MESTAARLHPFDPEVSGETDVRPPLLVRPASSRQPGDVLAVDNHCVAHGRLPYRGPRLVAVCWA